MGRGPFLFVSCKSVHEMTKQTTTVPTVPVVALKKWARDIGISDTTAWRWAKAGLIHPINIYGKLYLAQSDILQFLARAESGEFFRESPGICAKQKAAA